MNDDADFSPTALLGAGRMAEPAGKSAAAES